MVPRVKRTGSRTSIVVSNVLVVKDEQLREALGIRVEIRIKLEVSCSEYRNSILAIGWAGSSSSKPLTSNQSFLLSGECRLYLQILFFLQ
jgi:hypothetical protein